MPNLLRVALAVIIMSIPLYPKFPLSDVTGTYVNIRLDDVIIAVSVLVWLIYQIKNKFPVLREKIFWLFLTYWLVLLSASLNSLANHQIVPVSILFLHAFRRVEYMMVFFIAIDALKHKNTLIYPFLFTLLAVIGVAIVGLGQKYYSWPIISTMNEEFSKGQLLYMSTWTRISSTFAGHYDLAAFLSVVLAILGPVAVLIKKWFYRFPVLLIWIASFYTLTLTASRVSVPALWLSLTLAFILIRKKLWIIPTSLIILASVLGSGELNQRLLATFPTITRQLALLLPSKPTVVALPTVAPTTVPISTLPSISVAPIYISPIPTPIRVRPDDFEYPSVDVDAGVARSGEIRFKVEWPRAINAFKSNPLLGTGLGSITLATDNDFLRILGETGLLGFVSFFSIIAWFALSTLFPKRKTTNFYSKLNFIFLTGVFCMLGNAIFIDVFAASKTAYMFWIIMGIYYQSIKFSQNE